MLKKLLKYDFKSTLKYWWIMAVTSLLLSIICGIFAPKLFTTLNDPVEPEVFKIILGFFIIIFTMISYVVLSMTTVILVYVRFYTNFFTDEGYLTFTLPVKLSDLLNSKIITAFVSFTLTAVMIVLNIITLFAFLSMTTEIDLNEMLYSIGQGIRHLADTYGVYLAIYGIEIVLFIIISFICSILVTYCCITLASIIVKKAKMLVAILIYYVASGVYSLFLNLFYGIGTTVAAIFIETYVEHTNFAIALIGFTALCLMGIICMCIYLLQYWMLDRKLNLN